VQAVLDQPGKPQADKSIPLSDHVSFIPTPSPSLMQQMYLCTALDLFTLAPSSGASDRAIPCFRILKLLSISECHQTSCADRLRHLQIATLLFSDILVCGCRFASDFDLPQTPLEALLGTASSPKCWRCHVDSFQAALWLEFLVVLVGPL